MDTTPHDKNKTTLFNAIATGALLLILIVATVFFIDPQVNGKSIQDDLPGDISAFFQCISYFGHGTGCLIAMLLVWRLDCRKNAMTILIAAAGAGAITTIVKIAVLRPRPFVEDYLFANELTFEQAVLDSHFHSFPSGHTATAFALGAVLSAYYPKARFLFLSMAAIVGIQRVISSSHYPSDVMTGAVLGVVVATITVNSISTRSVHQPQFLIGNLSHHRLGWLYSKRRV